MNNHTYFCAMALRVSGKISLFSGEGQVVNVGKAFRECSQSSRRPPQVTREKARTPVCLLVFHETVCEQEGSDTNVQFSWFQAFTT